MEKHATQKFETTMCLKVEETFVQKLCSSLPSRSLFRKMMVLRQDSDIEKFVMAKRMVNRHSYLEKCSFRFQTIDETDMHGTHLQA
ncbi:unnamed protein product [Microthlaspi erraticum]|uniref:Uncharacterized protein n=1 Tax=Microthlaspi erraticum TaxID=1685480 RepID=A0A6D2ICG9_9BRAS|nr:unnamed protein product [Microthlaspi erraticum]